MMQKNQSFIKAAVIIVIVAGLLGALIILAGDIGPGIAKIFAICLSVIIYGITATISMVVTRKPEKQFLGNAGMLISAAGFLSTLIITVFEVADETLLKFAFALFITSIAVAHICLLHSFSLQNKYAYYARGAATIAIAVFSMILTVRIFDPMPGLYSFMYYQSSLKLIGATLIIDLAATLLVPLCNRIETPGPLEDLLSDTDTPVTADPVQEEHPTV